MSEPFVSYPISEILKQISDKIDKLFDALDGKADKAELASLAAKVQAHDERINTLLAANVAAATERHDRIEWRRWFVPVILSAAMVVVMALQVWGR